MNGAASRHGNIDFATVGRLPSRFTLISDVRLPLPWPAHSFGRLHRLLSSLAQDIIHIRSIMLEVPDYASIIERLAVTLRPGGMLVMMEAEPCFVSVVMFQWLIFSLKDQAESSLIHFACGKPASETHILPKGVS